MNTLLSAALGMAMDIFVRPRVRLAKVRLALQSLKTLKAVRKGVLAVSGLMFLTAVAAAGMIMIPMALCLFMPWTQTTRLVVALVVGALYIAVPITLVLAFLSERRWKQTLHIDELLNDAVADD